MAQFGKYFEYNGHSSQEFNLMLASFDEIDNYASGLEREIQRGDMNRYRFKPNHMGTVYSAPLEFEVTFIKDMCNGANLEFTRSEYRAIADWLTEPEYPSLYHMTDYEEDWADEEEDYFGVFSNVQNHAYGEVIGITATFTCDSPFAYSNEKTVLFLNENTTRSYVAPYLSDDIIEYSFTDSITKTFKVNSDVAYTYPIIRVFPNAKDATISIKNATENRTFTFVSLALHDLTTINSEKYTITDTQRGNVYLSDIGISDPSNVYWPRFLKGRNSFNISGNASVIFTYREIRKVGAY